MSLVLCVEAAGIIVLAIAGVFAGVGISRLKAPYWLIGFVVPMAFITMVWMGSWAPPLAVKAPLAWLLRGRTEDAVAAFMVPCVFATLVPKLRRRLERILVSVLAGIIVALFSLPSFLAPAIFLLHSGMTAVIDKNGVCMQSTGYTCGPAAAVTALRSMGLQAEERDLALLARTSPVTGTEPELLADALRDHYGSAGLACEYRAFDSLEALRAAGLTIAVVKLGLLLDHYVVVFEVTDTSVIVADPLAGTQRWLHANFLERWRRVGIVLARPGAAVKE